MFACDDLVSTIFLKPLFFHYIETYFAYILYFFLAQLLLVLPNKNGEKTIFYIHSLFPLYLQLLKYFGVHHAIKNKKPSLQVFLKMGISFFKECLKISKKLLSTSIRPFFYHIFNPNFRDFSLFFTK